MTSAAIVGLWALWMHHLTGQALAGASPGPVLGGYLLGSALAALALWVQFADPADRSA